MIKNNDKGRIHKAMIKRRRNARKDAKAAMQKNFSYMNALNTTTPTNRAESTDKQSLSNFAPSEKGARSAYTVEKRKRKQTTSSYASSGYQ